MAWPGIRNYFDLPVDALGLILLFGTSGYMLSSFFNGFILRILNLGSLLSISAAVTSISFFVHAYTNDWWVFIIFTVIIGLGAGATDASINTYIDS